MRQEVRGLVAQLPGQVAVVVTHVGRGGGGLLTLHFIGAVARDSSRPTSRPRGRSSCTLGLLRTPAASAPGATGDSSAWAASWLASAASTGSTQALRTPGRSITMRRRSSVVTGPLGSTWSAVNSPAVADGAWPSAGGRLASRSATGCSVR